MGGDKIRDISQKNVLDAFIDMLFLLAISISLLYLGSCLLSVSYRCDTSSFLIGLGAVDFVIGIGFLFLKCTTGFE